MYRKIAVLACTIFMLLFAAQLLTALYISRSADGFQAYSRLYRQDSDSSSVSFNWPGLVSWFQQEQQIVTYDTLHLRGRVIWPYGEEFQPVLPELGSEQQVADTIANRIETAIRTAQIIYQYDYDGTSAAVRRAARPDTVSSTRFLLFDVHLYSTASPEARKYGLQNSLSGDHVEYENMSLAEKRGDTSAVLLLPELQSRGLLCERVVLDSFDELQFGEREATLLAQGVPIQMVLDSMRYVEYLVDVPVQRVQIQTQTLPIGFPIWLGLLSLVTVFGWRNRRSAAFSRNVVTAAGLVAGILGVTYLLSLLPANAWWFLFWLLQFSRLILAVWMFRQLWKEGVRHWRWPALPVIDWVALWRKIAQWLSRLIAQLIGWAQGLADWVARQLAKIHSWWSQKTPGQKRIILLTVGLGISLLGNIAQLVYMLGLPC